MKKALDAFQRPFLAADRITPAGETAILLERGSCTLELEGANDIGEAIDWLTKLKDPSSESWRQRDSALLEELCVQGWIAEARTSLEPGASGICSIAKEWLTDGIEKCSDEVRARFSTIASEVSLLAEQRSKGALNCLWPAWPDTARGALMAQLAAWQRSAPESLNAVAEIFNDAVAPASQTPVAGGNETRVWQACALTALALNARADAEPEVPPFAGGEAINLLIDAERLAVRLSQDEAREWLDDLLVDQEAARRLGIAVFGHQAFVSTHYVECLLPLLRLKSSPGLRTRLRGYFIEELGHEEHELEACAQLGPSRADILELVPVPFMAAYVDVLAHLAEADPTAFLLCITIAEGLPGSTKSLPDELAAALGGAALSKHAAIDAALDHSFKARELAFDWHPVPRAEGREALRRFASILALTQQAWRQVAAAALEDRLFAQPFALSFDEVVRLFGEDKQL